MSIYRKTRANLYEFQGFGGANAILQFEALQLSQKPLTYQLQGFERASLTSPG
jgi:hypothetical protein